MPRRSKLDLNKIRPSLTMTCRNVDTELVLTNSGAWILSGCAAQIYF
jgi:hypothetical protein